MSDQTLVVTVADAQTNLLEYLQRVKAGETVIIVSAGKPIAELKQAVGNGETLRPFGLCVGEFETPADFDAPLPDAMVREFEHG